MKKKLLCLAITVICVLFIHSTVKADNEKIVLNGGFTMYYTNNGDGTVHITQIEITGNITSPDLVIPATIDGKKLEKIEKFKKSDSGQFLQIKSLKFEEGIVSVDLDFYYMLAGVEQLKLPSTMNGAQILEGMGNLQNIEVAQGNTAYCSEDGVLFNADKTKLLTYPPKKAGETYTIPNTVKEISDSAFKKSCVLKTLNLPASVTNIYGNLIREFESCETINVDANNLNYSSKDGMLFDKNQTTLISVPVNNKIIVLDIPSTVESIRYGAIDGHRTVKKIIMPESFEYSATIEDCVWLKSILFKGKAPYFVKTLNCGEVVGYYDSSKDDWSSCIERSSSLLWEDYAATQNVSELRIETVSDKIAVGDSLQMKTVFNPYLESNFTWTSSDNSVATVSDMGNVIGLKSGTATITVSSEDGKYRTSKTISVTGTQAALPQHNIVEVPAFTDISTERHQFASADRNGIYYFVNDDLYLYLLENNTNIKIHSFGLIESEYFANNKLYVTYGEMQCVFNLETHQVENFFYLNSFANTIGADEQGRIYTAGNHIISMYSANGEYITSTIADDVIYDFDGFDAQTGNIYYEVEDNYYYWGYDHWGKAIAVANVSNNTINVLNEYLEYACQYGYYQHNFNADLVDENYLVTTSTTFGRVTFLKGMSNGEFEIIKTIARNGKENVSDSSKDDSSIGVRAVCNKNRDSVIVYENGKKLCEYDKTTGEQKGEFLLQHYVYNLCKIGDTMIAVEKEDGKYYIECINWSNAEDLNVKGSAIMQSGESQQLEGVMSSVYKEQVKWSSSDSEVVAVSKAGMASAWREGTAVITCATKDGRKKVDFTIQVTANSTTPVLNHTSLSSGVVLHANQSLNNYTVRSKPVKSYLYENPDHSLTRVAYVDDKKVVVETYRLGKLESSKTIDAELELFGGFYHGNDYNYMVYGASNMNDSDNVEVMRVVKYDKDFNRLASKSISAINTYIPFDAGSLRMDETQGKLYIYTCHEMYQSLDGLHHQANMTFVLNEETLEIEDSYSDVMNIEQAGYVSHSFNQFIKTDGVHVYRVDHGDAAPRAVSITKCDVNGKITNVSYTLLLEINGQMGANATGVSVGGLELSNNNCIVVGNSVDQSNESTYNSNGVRNIFVSVTDKDLSDIQIIWLTNYTQDNKIQTYTPQLIKMDAAHFLVLWEERNTETGKIVTKAVTIDEDGTITTSVKRIDATLSDCQPIVTSNGTVNWYVTDGSTLTFYQLNPYSLNQMQSMRYGDVNGDGEINIADGVLLKKYLAQIKVTINEKAADVNVNGDIEIADVVLLLKYLAGMKVELGK